MKIAIDASRAFLDKRTGIEEYAFELVKNLRDSLKEEEVVLYLRRGGQTRLEKEISLPEKWQAKEINFKYCWTQVGMAWEFLTNPPDVLFIPAHTVPWIHPKNTVVTVHGLEYEHCPESYSLYSRLFHRFFIQKSCIWAKKIIAVSCNTKKDLTNLYQVPERKVKVIYNGFNESQENGIDSNKFKEGDILSSGGGLPRKFFLYIGRLEKRKNIEGIIKSFEIAKEELGYEGKLVLAGKPGYGYQEIQDLVRQSSQKENILETGYIESREKTTLLKQADVFLFPSFCEGFGIPILEAQSFSTPVITSDLGPMDEVAGDDRILADPKKPAEIAQKAVELVNNQKLRNSVIQKGRENVRKYSWKKCGRESAEIIKSQGRLKPAIISNKRIKG
ncbi:MAG: glycosyltransferase family 4 protein [Patescibacteria group bacterium]